jgi:hypothetical protein
MLIICTQYNPELTMKKETEDKFKKLLDDVASICVRYLINPFLGSLKS